MYVHGFVLLLATIAGFQTANATKLCGFIHLVHGQNTWSNVLFGDCQASRSYVCRNRSGPVRRLYATYTKAIQCHDRLTNNEIQDLPSGYYWKPENISYCQQQHTELTMALISMSNILCGVYSRDLGQAFYNCSERLNVACNIEPTPGVVYTPTAHDNYTSIGYYDEATSGVVPALSVGRHIGIGVKIGVPIAVSIVIISGVILSIILIRRWHKKRSNLNKERSRETSHHVYDYASEIDEQSDIKMSKGEKRQTENKSENVYENIGGDETEDVNNPTEVGTIQKGQELDKVYHKLTNDGSVEDTGYSELDFSSLQQNFKDNDAY